MKKIKEEKRRCPICKYVLYKKHEGMVCKNSRCPLYFKLGKGWVLINKYKTIEEDIINDLWNQDNKLIFLKKWNELKSVVLRRDNYQCRFCKYNLSKDYKREIGLEVHHIVPANEQSALYLDVENIITLCKECHIKLHCGDKHKFKKRLLKNE